MGSGSLDNQFEAHVNEACLFRNAGGFLRLLDEVLIEIQSGSHTDESA